jgi:hypothetical protein
VPEEKVQKISDASYEIGTDEYLSVVKCAVPERRGSRRYRSEALCVPSYRDGDRA